MGLLSVLVWGSFVGTIVYILLKSLERYRNYWTSRGVPRLTLPGLYARIFQNMSFFNIDRALYKQSKDAFGGFLEMLTPMLFVRDLDIAKNIYVKDFDYFVNRRFFKINDEILNGMLVTKCDREWKELRATMSPTFTTGKIRRMFPIMNESSKKLISHLEAFSAKNDGGMVDFEDALGRYAMDVVSSAAFGIESEIFSNEDSIVSKMAKKLQFKLTPLKLLQFGLTMIHDKVGKILNLKFVDEEAGNFFTKVITDSIKQRESSGEKRNDFLQLMIETKKGALSADRENEEMDTYERDAQLTTQDSGKKNMIPIDDDLIVANCILFIFGGFDTTQSALTFGAYALALNPDVQETLRREMLDATENTGGELTYDIVTQAEYLEKVVNEILRMYPPGLRTERLCSKDYLLPNKSVVPKDTVVIIPVYNIHHDEKHFPNPDVFDPERFSPEGKASRHPYAYMPFGHGPRNCIANRFALTETKAAIAKLVLHFDIEPCSKTTIPMVFSKTTNLKPNNGMWLKMKPRVK